jgi:hypothetical protein
MKDLTTYRRDNDMPCAICNSDDCEMNYTEEDLYLSNPFIPSDTWTEPPTADHTDPLYQG